MKLDLSRFLEFPGILVVVGIVLILIAIVIGIFAVANDKKEEKKEEEQEIDEDEYNVDVVKLVDNEEVEKQKNESQPVELIKNNVVPTPIDDETVLEDTDSLEPAEEDFLETREFVILDNVEKQDTTDVETL